MNQTTSQPGGRTTALVHNTKDTPTGHKPSTVGARPGAPPLLPPNHTNDSKRSIIVKFRVTSQEHERLLAKVPGQGQTARGISKLIRERLFSSCNSASSSANSARSRLLAAIKAELHQIARRANSIDDPHTVVEVLAHLASLDHQIEKLGRQATTITH